MGEMFPKCFQNVSKNKNVHLDYNKMCHKINNFQNEMKNRFLGVFAFLLL